MGIKFIEDTSEGRLGFWEINETTDQLMLLLRPSEDELDSYLPFRNELRRKEWLAARLLLKQMIGSNSSITYDPTGKPLLQGSSGHISISHSANCVVIYYCHQLQPGIDIELITRNVERAARKFLSPEELNDCTFNGLLSNRELMLRWCAKEAVFKMVPYTNIDFASQILCEASPLNASQGGLTAIFINKEARQNIRLHYRLVGEMLMVWGIYLT
ncbi:MAG TPA: 4'-phosphopantetheinyl transferase superfamily protein [Prolixibacteraceae bacterium]